MPTAKANTRSNRGLFFPNFSGEANRLSRFGKRYVLRGDAQCILRTHGVQFTCIFN